MPFPVAVRMSSQHSTAFFVALENAGRVAMRVCNEARPVNGGAAPSYSPPRNQTVPQKSYSCFNVWLRDGGQSEDF